MKQKSLPTGGFRGRGLDWMGSHPPFDPT
jgi:hypothetical protein